MLTTPELITALERRGVLAPSDVARVRQLHENSPTEFVPRVLFKWLVSRGRMTLDEADRLLRARLRRIGVRVSAGMPCRRQADGG